MKLIPLSDFVEKYTAPIVSEDQDSSDVAKLLNNLKLISGYTKFLKQPLALGMFVPVDNHGIVLEPLKFCCNSSDCGCMGMPVNVSSQQEIDEYYQAQEKVLFEGFEIYNCGENSDGLIRSVVRNGNCYVGVKYERGNFHLNDYAVNYSVEKLVNHGLELTPSALKQIGL